MKSVCYSLVGLIVAAFVMTSVPVFAQESTGMTDEHIARIKSNCQSALGTLSTIHANDAPIYVNRNQNYFSIGDKLMARLNSRLTANRYDISDLARLVGQYDAALMEFRSSYKLYDDTMSDILRMNCIKQPVSFYDKVAEAREQRQKVNETVVELTELIGQYERSVQNFRVLHLKELLGGRS